MNNPKLLNLSLLLVTLATISHDAFAMRRRRPARRRTSVFAFADKNIVKACDVDNGADWKDYYGFETPINDIVFNHDGTRLAACANDEEKIIIWDSSDADYHNWTQLKTIIGHTKSIAFSPDGTKFAYGSGDGTSEGPIVILDISSPTPEEWKVLKKLRVEYRDGSRREYISLLLFSPDGTKLAFATPGDEQNGVIQIWDTARWILLKTFWPGFPSNYTVNINSIAFSHDTKKLVSAYHYEGPYRSTHTDYGSGNKTWNISSPNPRDWTELAWTQEDYRYSSSAVLSPDGTKWACNCRIFNAEDWTELTTLELDETDSLHACYNVFNYDGTRLASMTSKPYYNDICKANIHIWNTSHPDPSKWTKLRILELPYYRGLELLDYSRKVAFK